MSDEPTKRCGKCGIDQPADSFYTDPTRPDGRHPYCPVCQRAFKRNLRTSRVAAGLCARCGLRPLDSPGKACRECFFTVASAARFGTVKHAAALAAMFAAQGGRCAVTGAALRVEPGPTTWDSASLDHVVPTSRGGVNDPSNCRWVTNQVNMAKGNGTDRELRAMSRAVLRTAGELPDNDDSALDLVAIVREQRWIGSNVLVTARAA